MTWPSKPLGELARLINGRAFKPSDWGQVGLPIVRIQNLNDHSKPFNYYAGSATENHLIDEGAILLSWSGTPGTSFGCFRWHGGKAVLNQHIFKVLVDTEQMDGDFFIHAVNSKLSTMIDQAHGGVGLRHITKSRLEAIPLQTPSLPDQRLIVARIRECMLRIDEIERLRAQNAKDAQILASSCMEALEEVGKYPEVTVADVISGSQNGRSIRPDNVNGNGFVLSIRAVHSVSLDISAKKPAIIPDATATSCRISQGDVFVSRANTMQLVGLSSIATDDVRDRVIFPDLLIKLKPKREICTPRYLAYALRIPASRRQIQDRAVGSSQSMVKISAQRLKEVRIPLPSLKEQGILVEKFDEIQLVAAQIQEAMRASEVGSIRASVLRKAFAGEV